MVPSSFRAPFRTIILPSFSLGICRRLKSKRDSASGGTRGEGRTIAAAGADGFGVADVLAGVVADALEGLDDAVGNAPDGSTDATENLFDAADWLAAADAAASCSQYCRVQLLPGMARNTV